MNNDERYIRLATYHDRKGDQSIWASAMFCARVVERNGKGERGKTLQLADNMSRSPDTVEDRAHGYWMFEELCKLENGKFRLFVRNARKLPYIHFSHFRELYDLKNQQNLTTADCLSLLMDLVQAEGGISSRKLGEIAREKYGDTRDWKYYAQKAQKRIHEVILRPDTPKDVREVLSEAYEKLGEQA